MSRELTYLLAFVLLLGTAAPSMGDAADPSLVGWWTFDGHALDTSGNERHGTLHGSPQFVPGVFGEALECQANPDYVTIDGYKGILGTHAFSITAWVRTTNTAIEQLVHWGADVNGERVEFRINSNRLRISHGNGNVQGNTDLTDGQWHHVAVTVVDNATASSGDVLFYVDGQDDTMESTDPDSWNITPNPTLDLTIGWRPTQQDRPFIGTIDEVQIYDKALTPEEVQQTMEQGGEPYPYALSPNPADGALVKATWTNITWSPGALAVSHDVYLGNSFDDVNAGTHETGAFLGNQTTPSLIVGFPGLPYPDGLVPGTTYYWRVDEVNDADPNRPWKGKVWSFTIPSKTAYSPSPREGATNVLTDADLSWSPGLNAMLHYVYFGGNFDDVNNAVSGSPLTDTVYDPGPLAKDTAYYWRVDEFVGTETRKGHVWSFRTLPDIQVVAPDPNLAGWWTFDEGQGSVSVLDRSGNGRHGTLAGDPLWVEGYDGGALELSGNDYVTMAGYKGVLGTHAFSVSVWLKTTSAGIQELLWWGTESGGQRVEFRVHDDGHIRMGAGNGQVESQSQVTDGQWHHVVATVVENATNSSSDVRIYIDGKDDTVASTDADAFGLVSGLDVTVGWRPSSGDRPFAGSVDDIRIYDKVLTPAEVELLTRIDLLLAWNQSPKNGATPDVENATPLTWSPGDKASRHDVYFSTDRDAAANADASDATGVYRGGQSAASYAPAEGLAWGGGPYFWRVDENNTDGTISKGRIWSFTVADYLVVDDIESYNDLAEDDPASNRIYLTWIDGFGTTTNGAFVGNLDVPLTEYGNVHGGSQAMPLSYDNNLKFSEATITLTAGRDWTRQEVAELSLWFRGAAANAGERMYVALNGTAVVYHDDPNAVQITNWTEWVIPLQQFADLGVNLTNVTSLTIGFGTRGNTTLPGGTGQMYFDDIRLYRPAEQPQP